METALGRHKILKVIRWALYLSELSYLIEHVPGDLNFWPYIMSIWMRGYLKLSHIRRVTKRLPFIVITQTPCSDNLLTICVGYYGGSKFGDPTK